MTKPIHTGRRRLEITTKKAGLIVFHKAGPSNIVLGLWRKWLNQSDFPRRCPFCGVDVPAKDYKVHEEEHRKLAQV
jgi:surfactin synthase thioesterase subunit